MVPSHRCARGTAAGLQMSDMNRFAVCCGLLLTAAFSVTAGV
jgi:hypothetical protein